MICHLCGVLLEGDEGALFSRSARVAPASPAHVECVALESLGLIHRREVDRALFLSLITGSNLN
ncbi:MAG TPA: hypothetical protein VKG45_02790 [Actinomycetes bacterium]|nr:hypothetical protein [Actinomycetes bacterium]